MFRFDFNERFGGRERLERDLKNWAQGLFLKDWTLKLLALGITLALWYGVTGQRAPVTERIPGVQLTFRLPDKLVISNNPRSDVELSVTGARQVLDRLRGRDLEVVVSLGEFGPGDHTVVLNAENVKVSLPEGVSLNRVEPNTIKVRLEMSVAVELPVEISTGGNLAEGYELYATNVQPTAVRVTGPASRVKTLTKIEAEPFAFNGQRESFTVERLRLRLPDDQVDLMDALVKVTFEIGEQRMERTLEGVIVRAPDGFNPTPDKADVKIFGPRSLVEKTRPTDVEIILTAQNGAAPLPTLHILRQDVAGAVKMSAIAPTVFALNK
jgi:hypothetical protein